MDETLDDKVVMYGTVERKPKRFNVTETQAYREVYANNLRMYSFLMKKELDRRKQHNLRNRKEEYFQKHLSLESNQRNNRLLKSFRQMSRMRTCLSDLDLSRNPDSDWEQSRQDLSSVKSSNLQLDLGQHDLHERGHKVQERPRSWTALDPMAPKVPSSAYLQGRRSSAFATTTGNSKFLSVPALGRTPSPLTSPNSNSYEAPVLLVSPTRQTYLPSFRRHVSDLGFRRTTDVDPNIASDSDNAESENEVQSENGNKETDAQGNRSPILQRARQAKKRHDYRKARIASLENEILQADSMLRDFRRRSREFHESIPEDG